MPTFFGRRYMRDKAGPIERWVGPFCLLLAVGLAAGFVIDARRVKAPFFAVAPELQPVAPTMDQRHARSLLPDQPTPGWALSTGDIEIQHPAAPAESVHRMFVGRYLDRLDSRRQLTARITETDGPVSAKKLFDAVRPANAVGEPLGKGGWKSPDGTVAFWGGRYCTLVNANSAAAGASLTPQLLARELAGRQVAYDAPADGAGDATALAGLGSAAATGNSTGVATPAALPPIPGGAWTGPLQTATFDPTNLWEKIDGRADAYLAYDFRKMTFGTYRLTADAAATVDAFVFEMGDATKSLGIYKSERPEKATAAKIGADGYASVGGLFFAKGKAYVQLIAGEGAAISAEQLMTVGQTVAGAIADEGGADWADVVLPKEGRVPGSMEFMATDVFSLDFLHDVFSAKYADGDEQTALFIHRAADAAAAVKMFEQYEKSLASLNGKVLAREDADGGRYAEYDVGGEFDLIFQRGRYFGGANAAPNLDVARKRVRAFRDAIPKE